MCLTQQAHVELVKLDLQSFMHHAQTTFKQHFTILQWAISFLR